MLTTEIKIGFNYCGTDEDHEKFMHKLNSVLYKHLKIRCSVVPHSGLLFCNPQDKNKIVQYLIEHNINCR